MREPKRIAFEDLKKIVKCKTNHNLKMIMIPYFEKFANSEKDSLQAYKNLWYCTKCFKVIKHNQKTKYCPDHPDFNRYDSRKRKSIFDRHYKQSNTTFTCSHQFVPLNYKQKQRKCSALKHVHVDPNIEFFQQNKHNLLSIYETINENNKLLVMVFDQS